MGRTVMSMRVRSSFVVWSVSPAWALDHAYAKVVRKLARDDHEVMAVLVGEHEIGLPGPQRERTVEAFLRESAELFLGALFLVDVEFGRSLSEKPPKVRGRPVREVGVRLEGEGQLECRGFAPHKSLLGVVVVAREANDTQAALAEQKLDDRRGRDSAEVPIPTVLLYRLLELEVGVDGYASPVEEVFNLSLMLEKRDRSASGRRRLQCHSLPPSLPLRRLRKSFTVSILPELCGDE